MLDQLVCIMLCGCSCCHAKRPPMMTMARDACLMAAAVLPPLLLGVYKE